MQQGMTGHDAPWQGHAARKIAIFLASPSADTLDARACVVDVVQEINADPAYAEHVQLVLLRWDDPHRPVMVARDGNPQQDIVTQIGSPAECDLVLGILANTMGGTLPPDRYPPPADRSEPWYCTEWEIEQGLKAGRTVWVFHDQRQPASKKKEAMLAAAAVSSYIDRHNPPGGPMREGWNPFDDEADLADRLRKGLRRWLHDRFVQPIREQRKQTQNPASGTDASSGSVSTPVDLQEIQMRQRKRLRRLKEGFAGKFGEALWQELDTKFDDLTEGMKSSPDAVADCFAKVPAEQAGNLFYALKQACRLTKNLNEAESSLLAELLIHAAMRVVDVSLWCVPELWRNGAPASRACVHALPASSSLLAAVGFAGLHGLTLRMGHGSAPDGVIDLSRMEFDSIVADSVMRALYDEVFKTEARRLNPDEPLTDGRDGKESEVDKLRVRLGELAYNKMVVTIYLRAPALDGQMKQEVLTEVAETINSRVVLGSSTNDPQLMQAATGVTPGDLLIHVMELLAYTGVASDEVPAPAATADQAVASVRPPPPAPAPAEPEYKYDLFISHASEDKISFVDQLVEALKAAGLNIWYDKEQLKLGDSISASINRALTESRHGLVVFSPHFLAKNWPQAEQQALFSLSLQSGRKRLLPVLHGVTVEQVSQRLPLLADRLFCDTRQGLPVVVSEILKVVTTEPRNH